MRMRAALGAGLALTIVVAACGGEGSDQPKAADTSTSTSTTSTTGPAGTTSTTAPGRPEGTYDGVSWKVDEKPDANGTCQTVRLSGRPTDFLANDTKSCVPVPSRDSEGSDPVELASGTNEQVGDEPMFISGFTAPEIQDVQVSTDAGPATVTRWPSGGFIAWSSSPARTVTFTIDGDPRSCAVEWVDRDGTAWPSQRCPATP
jgi:hypothetical protein